MLKAGTMCPKRLKSILCTGMLMLFLCPGSPAWSQKLSDSSRRQVGNEPIHVLTSSEMAEAITSIKWDGVEFIDAHDHGRELQSAASFDDSGECYNPTEAGARDNGTGSTTSSSVLSFVRQEHSISATTRMALWLHDGQSSPGCPQGKQSPATRLSDVILEKNIAIKPKQIDFRINFETKNFHKNGVFEILTGYMPQIFSKFYAVKPGNNLIDVSMGKGEQSYPLMFSDDDSSHAMGIICINESLRSKISYGRFNISNAKVVKWNCVDRGESEVQPGPHRFRAKVFVGNVTSVQEQMSFVLTHQSGDE